MPDGIDEDTLLFDATEVDEAAPLEEKGDKAEESPAGTPEEKAQGDEVEAGVADPKGELDAGAPPAPHLTIRDEHGRVVKTFATPEDAEKSYRELEKYLGRKDSELNQLRTAQKVQRLEERLTEDLTAKQAETARAELTKLRAEINDKPELAVDLLIQQERSFNDRLANLEQRLRDERVKESADYAQHQKMVDALVDRGMSVRDAVAFVKENAPSAPASPVKPVQPAARRPAPVEPVRASAAEGPTKRLSKQAAGVVSSWGLGQHVGGVEKRFQGGER